MTTTDVCEFYGQLAAQKSVVSLTRLFRAAVARFGIDTFACGELDLNHRQRSVFYVIDWPPAWREFYLKSRLIDHDPVIDTLSYRREPFTWSQLIHDRRFGKVGRAALRAAAAQGWLEGLVVPMPGRGGRVGLVSMTGSNAAFDAEGRSYLTLISFGFQLHVRALVAQQGFAAPPAGLSPREIECLRLVARGEPDLRVAAALGVARSTAHGFVESAKRRLQVHTRAEMIAVAVALGIVDL
ncbi:MAG TPA: autoinducer binding domain-containing protein [Steroidobacteraceae bacterium]|nr:autoinducer binding domain-containing protein [Steroidobacteraceae bacterium]